MLVRALVCAAVSTLCVQGLLVGRNGLQTKQRHLDCAFDTYLNGRVQKKVATADNVIFRSRDVLVVQDGATRIMVFLKEASHCSEQAQVDCGPSPITGQALLQNGLGEEACAKYKSCQPDSTPNLGYPRSMIGGAVSTRGDKLHRVAVIGVGAGMIPLWFARAMPSTQVDAIDISEDVIATAPCFGLFASPKMKFVTMDGGRYLAGQPDGSYDAVFVDALTDRNFVPDSLKTVDFFRMVKGKLMPGGVLTMNIFRNPIQELNTVYMSLKQVFPDSVKVGLSPGLLNIVLLAQAPNADGSAAGNQNGTTSPRAARLVAAHGWANEASFQAASPEAVIANLGRRT